MFVRGRRSAFTFLMQSSCFACLTRQSVALPAQVARTSTHYLRAPTNVFVPSPQNKYLGNTMLVEGQNLSARSRNSARLVVSKYHIYETPAHDVKGRDNNIAFTVVRIPIPIKHQHREKLIFLVNHPSFRR